MKNLVSSALCRKRKPFAPILTSDHHVLFFSTVLFIGFLMTGCQKENLNTTAQEEIQGRSNQSVDSESNGFGNYKSLAAETVSELQQAKIATAKYNNFDNAINDGYVDINVIVPEMGYHFLKMKNLDATF